MSGHNVNYTNEEETKMIYQKEDKQAMYTAYAKDIFIAMFSKLDINKGKMPKDVWADLVESAMWLSISLVKQARDTFAEGGDESEK